MTHLTSLPIFILAGPTASGKSALALEIAAHQPVVIINADALQVYSHLPLLSAQPSAQDLSSAPHRLYGVFHGHEQCSVGKWLTLVKEEIHLAHQQEKIPLLVGGTGLYLRSLIYGIAEIPPVSDATKAEVQTLLATHGQKALYQLLQTLDPITSSKIHPNDRQRLLRAMEVVKETNIPLSTWQKMPTQSPFPSSSFRTAILIPERTQLYTQCNERFLQMIAQGVLEEVETFMKLPSMETLPAFHTLGTQHLIKYLKGIISLEETTQLAQTETRHYAKRQLTWFRHQLPKAHSFTFDRKTSLFPQIPQCFRLR